MALRLRIIYDIVGWAYYFRAQALAKYAPPDFEVSTARETSRHRGLGDGPWDLVFAINYRQARATREALERRAPGALLVTSFNTGWPRRRADLETCRATCDATVINNRETWRRAGRPCGTHPISNGVDLDVFRCRVPPPQRRPRVLWCGSTQHRELKGYDDFLLPMADRLKEHGMGCDLFLTEDAEGPHLKSHDELCEWYNGGTIYVCASRVEGTPNPALEAAASGCVVVSTPVGDMPELIEHGKNGFLVERRVDALVDGVLRARERYVDLAAAMQRSIRAWHWARRSREYYALFRELLGVRPAGG